MALTAYVKWEVQGDGNDNNGGGFDDTSGTPGTDYTYGAGKTVITWLSSGGTYTNNLAITNASPSVVSSASRNFVAADVGNMIHLTAGTNVTAGWYQIMSVASNQATLDRDAMTGAPSNDGSGYLGGALASIGGLGAALDNAGESGHIAYMKYYAGGYSVSSSSANVSGGWLSLYNSGSARMSDKKFYLEGYNTTREDMGTPPKVTSASNSTYVVEMGGYTSNQQYVINVELDVADYTAIGYRARGSAYGRCINCIVRNASPANQSGFNNLTAIGCESYSNQRGYGSCWTYDCLSDGDKYGLYYSTGIRTLIINTASGGYPVSFGSGSYNNLNLTIYNCPSHAIYQASTGYGGLVKDCVCSNVGGAMFYGLAQGVVINCAGYSITSGRGTVLRDINPIALTASPFMDAANDDFRLNNDSGGGALCRNVGLGIPGQTDDEDIGAVQTTVRYPFTPGSADENLVLAKETGANAYGGSGTCAKLSPVYTSRHGYWDFLVYVPATEFALVFRYKSFHTTSAWNGECRVSMWDVADAFTSVGGLLDSVDIEGTYDGTWRQWQSASKVSMTGAGLARVRFELKNGSDSGGLYIDDIVVQDVA